MFINELPSGEPTSGQVLAVDDGTETYKIDYDALADAIINKMLSNKVANDLVTTAAGLVLDARQGKALKDLHDTNASNIASLNSSLTPVSAACSQIAAGTVNANSVIKVGNIVFLTFSVSGASIAGVNGTICQLPVGFIPSARRDIRAQVVYGGNKDSLLLKIQPDGKVQTQIGGSTVTEAYIYCIPFPL